MIVRCPVQVGLLALPADVVISVVGPDPLPGPSTDTVDMPVLVPGWGWPRAQKMQFSAQLASCLEPVDEEYYPPLLC